MNQNSFKNIVTKNIATILSQGGVVIIPTETVYGIAVDATNNLAVSKLYALKSRLDAKPIQLMVKSFEVAKLYGNFGLRASFLAEKHWPGPLTIVVSKNKNSNLSPAINKVNDTIGIRIPSHENLLQLLSYINFPLAVTSANISGDAPATDATSAKNIFLDKIDGILEGQPSKFGVASTVIDATSDEIKIIRQGPLTID